MSYGSFVNASIGERNDKRKAADERRSAERAVALAAIREHMPSMVDDRDQVDGWAVMAYLELKRAGRDVKPSAVTARRRRYRLPDGRTVAQAENEAAA